MEVSWFHKSIISVHLCVDLSVFTYYHCVTRLARIQNHHINHIKMKTILFILVIVSGANSKPFLGDKYIIDHVTYKGRAQANSDILVAADTAVEIADLASSAADAASLLTENIAAVAASLVKPGFNNIDNSLW